jgi:TetR/AcrR family transcriptional regulator, cholesterol catabolism regulator
MDPTLREIIEKFRDYLYNKNSKAVINLEEISSRIGIPREVILNYVSGEEELVEKVLDFERQRFEEIFKIHDFEGVNAIDILLIVSKELAEKFMDISPSVTFVLKNLFPEIYQQHFILRRDFIYDKIQINLSKGINQGMYRDDLSIELVARLYLSRLIDLHNPDFFPAEQFSFDTLFNVMFESFIRSIAKPEGLAYYEKKKKNFKFRD